MYQDNLKLTKIGWLPKEWEDCQIKDVAKVTSGTTPLRSQHDKFFKNGDIFWVKTTDLTNGDILQTEENVTQTAINETSLRIYPKGTLLVAMYGGFNQIGRTGLLKIDAAVNQALSALTFQKDIDSKFALEWFNYNVGLWKNFAGSSRKDPNITSKDVADFPFIKLPLAEQQKIASILRGCDAVIDKTQALINALQKRHKALMQQLLTGKKRVLGFEKEKGFHFTDLGLKIPKNWKIINVEDIFNERNEKSNDQTAFPLYSLTIEKGLTAKTDRYDRSFLLKDKEANEFKVVSPMDLLFNPMNLRFGAIAMSYENQKVSVSAYYNILIPKVKLIDSFFYESIFKSKRFIGLYDRIAIGSLNEKKRVHLSNFLKLEIPFPSLAEQQEIAEILRGSEKEIQLYEKQLAALKQQKRGLMQVLLTGRVRVKSEG